MKKNQIKEVRIERVYDESAYTNDIGKYTDKADDWLICVHCGEYVAIAEKDDKRAEEIEDEIIDLENSALYNENENDIEAEIEVKKVEAQIEELKKERESLELHECPHSSRQYNYFQPYAGGEKEGTEEYQKYGLQDFKRMEGLNNGNWQFIGIIAKAEIVTSNDTLQTIRSGGLWGIESDAGDDYLEEVGKEELENLRSELMALGFGKRAIDYAFKNVETVDK